ncbi:MAG: DUF2834 domain-containing protein [Limnospira sp.]
MSVSTSTSIRSLKITLWLVWLGFVAYAFLWAPPDRPEETLALIQNLSFGNWEGINPLIIALFNLMGIWPLVYSGLVFADGRGQKIPAWPFAALSFGVGAFALLPYLALRQSNPDFPGPCDRFIRLWDSRFTGIILTAGAIALVGYGFTQGDWGDFVRQWQTSRFIHVMSLDFCLLSALFPALLGDDMARRGMDNSALFWIVALIPLFGPLFYLFLRPPLSDSEILSRERTAIAP